MICLLLLRSVRYFSSPGLGLMHLGNDFNGLPENPRDCVVCGILLPARVLRLPFNFATAQILVDLLGDKFVSRPIARIERCPRKPNAE